MANQAANPYILDNDRIHTRCNNGAEILFCLYQFPGKNQCIESDIAFHPPMVQECHQLGQLRFCNVLRPHPCIKPIQPEIDGIGTIFYSSFGTVPMTCGSKQFWSLEGW